jgi:hypothetical protein
MLVDLVKPKYKTYVAVTHMDDIYALATGAHTYTLTSDLTMKTVTVETFSSRDSHPE